MLHRLILAIAGVACGAAGVAQTPTHYAAFVQSYPQLQKVTVQRLVHDARRAGIVQTQGDLVALKWALYQLRASKDGLWTRSGRLDMAPAVPGPAVGVDAVGEVENNDLVAFGDDLGADAASATGDNTSAGDSDVFVWTLTAAAHVTATISGAIPDSTLELLAGNGESIAFNDDAPGLGFLSQVHLFLPAGDYCWKVGSYFGQTGGSYTLTVAVTPTTPPSCAGGGVGTTGVDAWSLPVATDAVVDLVVTVTNPGADLAMALIHPDGTVAFYNDDAGGATDPRINLGLPAATGTYFVDVIDLAGGAEPYSISCTMGSVLADVCAAGTVTGTIAGPEQADTYRVTLPVAGRVELVTANDPASTSNIGDTIVALFDADYRLIAELDDTNLLVPLFTRVDVNLPAGTYYAQVRGFGITSGDYQLTANCALPLVAPGTFWPGAGNVVATATDGTIGSSVLSVCQSDRHVFSMSGDYYGVIDGNGRAVIGNTIRSDYLDPQERSLAAGDHYVLTYDRTVSNGIRGVDIHPSALSCDGSGDLVQRAKAGDLVVAIASWQVLPTGISVHPAIQGLLCLPNAVTINFLVASPAGLASYGACVPGSALYFQSGNLGGPNGTLPPSIIGVVGGVYFDP